MCVKKLKSVSSENCVNMSCHRHPKFHTCLAKAGGEGQKTSIGLSILVPRAAILLASAADRELWPTPRQNALRMSMALSFRLTPISGCVLKSNVNRVTSRTAKFENKKSKLACEGRRKISLVAKFILHLTFKIGRASCRERV